MARPKKEIDETKLYELAKIGCTNEEMAAMLDCHKDTLTRNYADLIEKGRQDMTGSLRRMQYKAAQDGNVTMQIWLGKQLLGQTEKLQNENYNKNFHISDKPLTEDEFATQYGVETTTRSTENTH